MAGLLPRRRTKTQFQRAAEGSMSLMEHLQELRSRLFKASLGVVAGLCVGLFFAGRVTDYINQPYCDFRPDTACQFSGASPLDAFLLNLRVALYLGLVLAAPIWLYQLWAFIAPGLHRKERRYTYIFTAAATPLFLTGMVVAHFVVAKSMHFFLGMSNQYSLIVDLQGYFNFVTGMMLLFGAGFEFPLIVVMLNFAGVISARRLLSWWRAAVFLMFLFAAVVTPTPDPFAMSILAGAMATLYFGAVGIAFVNDRRRSRKNPYAELADDQISPLKDDEAEPVTTGSQAEGWRADTQAEPVAAPLPLDRRYDDVT